MSTEPVRLDRRHLRREETLRQVVAIAEQVMAEEGAGGLSLGEVARRLGVRTPSLYTYVPSKNALYDAVFARGWRLLGAELDDAAEVAAGGDLSDRLTASATALVRWTMQHPAQAALMFWRPVPGWEPSEEAYAAAVEVWEQGARSLAAARDDGLLDSGADLDLAYRTWSTMVAGVVSQQLSNAPDESYDEARFVAALPELVAMFVARYGASGRGARRPRTRGSRR